MTFFWYDYETFGARPAVDRPVQFAGVRTNEQLEIIDDPVVLYCRPAPDYLPNPEACLIHGITPMKLLDRGISEADFAHRVHKELSRPDTCTVGYNAMRFDHEVTRYLLYRNLRDPYGWHWRNNNSKWDVIDLVRAAYALRPDGINWPQREDGAPSFRLEDLAAANKLRHLNPHEAYADVQTTIDLARLIRERQPDLFAYALKLRSKRDVSAVVREPFVWVSSLISAERGCVSLMAPVADHPGDSSGVIVMDLCRDPAPFLKMNEDQLRNAIFARREDLEGDRAPLYTIKTNASPFVARAGLLDAAVRERFGLDDAEMRTHYRALQQADGFAERARKAYERTFDDSERDVDEALYDRFIPDGDRDMLTAMIDTDRSLDGAPPMSFEDDRIPELVFRYRARNYPDLLSEEDRDRWRSHCRTRLLEPDAEGTTRMDAYEAAIDALRAEHDALEDVTAMLDDLAVYGRRLRRWLD